MPSQSQESQPAKASASQDLYGNASVPKEARQSIADRREGMDDTSLAGGPIERRSPALASSTSRGSSQSMVGQKRLASGSIKIDAGRPSMSMPLADTGVDPEPPSAERIREVSVVNSLNL